MKSTNSSYRKTEIMNKRDELLGESNIYVCLGSPQHLPDLRGLSYPDESVYWTIKKTAKKGDKAIFYLTAPVSAVVGFGSIIDDPWEEPKSEWKEKNFTEINRIRIFDENQFITNRQIRELFPEWRFMLQPRQSVAMLADIQQPFWELLSERLENEKY